MNDNGFQEETFQSKFNKKTILRIFLLLKPYPIWVAAFLVSIIINGITDSSQFYLMKMLVDDAVAVHDLSKLPEILKIFVGVFVVQSMSMFGLIYFSGILSEKLIYSLRKNLFSHLQKLSLSYYAVTPVGWIMSRVNSDTYRIGDIVTWGVIDASYALVSIITSLYFMARINIIMSLFVVAILPALIWIAWQFLTRILHEYRNARRLNSRITGAFNESISGIRVIKSFHQEEKSLNGFMDLTGAYYKSAYHAAVLNALFLPSVQILVSLLVAAVIWYSGVNITTGLLTVGGIQAFINYIFSILWPIQDLARVYGELQQSVAAAERVFSLADAVPEVLDRENTVPVETLKGTISFKDVSFYYSDGNGEKILTDFDLDVKPGEVIALVGETGGGKTTIVNLLCRFYEPQSGSITIGGRDYRDFEQTAYRSHIGIVLQTPHLFSGTIMENIRYGKLDATDEEIIQAAKISGAYEFISKFPNQFEEQVGESGGHLSVGQKQLISLARAILKDPDIFIMDEATSSIDTVTENIIQQGMDKIMENRTCFIIAHRLSTIRNADRILVIEKGRIVESGTHRELLNLQGKYYNLYTKQFREEKELLYRKDI